MSVLYYGRFAAAHFQNFTASAAPRRQTLFWAQLLYTVCYYVGQMSMNTFGYFMNCRQTLIFLCLEVSRGKYPIIKYREFLAAVHKSCKWELFVVPTNIVCLVIYEAKNAITVVINEHLFWLWPIYLTL